MSTLIVLRGPSGSGKSSIARSVRSAWGTPIALVEQDYLRRTLLQEKDIPDGKNIGLIKQTVFYLLAHDLDVIMEGIFHATRYNAMFEEILAKYHVQSHFFYFDISLDETLRRHETRPQKHEFGEAEMRRWYNEKNFLPCVKEHIIPESNAYQTSVDFIIQTSKNSYV